LAFAAAYQTLWTHRIGQGGTLLDALCGRPHQVDLLPFTGRLGENDTLSLGMDAEGLASHLPREIEGLVDINKLRTITGSDGRYSLPIEFDGASEINVGVVVDKKDFVRIESKKLHPIHDGLALSLDFTLMKGEWLAGTVRVPLEGFEKRHGIKLEDKTYVLDVTGPGFQQYCYSEKGGHFAICVPRGTCSAALVIPPWPRIEWHNLRAGSTDLMLVPEKLVLTKELLGKEFDWLWEWMDCRYSYFFLKKNVNWESLKAEYRPQAVDAKSIEDFVKVLQRLLAPLKDLHIWIETPAGAIGTFRSAATGNRNLKVTMALLEQPETCGPFAIVGKTKGEDFGYVLITRQSSASAKTVAQAVQAIQRLKDAPGFIVDLREANGGSEPLALEIARQFCGKDAVYAKSKYRVGSPNHDDFGPTHDRVIKATDKAYRGPIICLQGRRCVSSGEGFLQMMKCLPNVTTVGQPSRGASGNPLAIDLPRLDVTVYVPSWVDMMPDGSIFEGVGIKPDVEINLLPEAYQNEDPTLAKALVLLRERVRASPASQKPSSQELFLTQYPAAARRAAAVLGHVTGTVSCRIDRLALGRTDYCTVQFFRSGSKRRLDISRRVLSTEDPIGARKPTRTLLFTPALAAVVDDPGTLTAQVARAGSTPSPGDVAWACVVCWRFVEAAYCYDGDSLADKIKEQAWTVSSVSYDTTQPELISVAFSISDRISVGGVEQKQIGNARVTFSPSEDWAIRRYDVEYVQPHLLRFKLVNNTFCRVQSGYVPKTCTVEVFGRGIKTESLVYKLDALRSDPVADSTFTLSDLGVVQPKTR
jgi:Peptidase family S41/Tricorn protease C1 domain